MCGDMNNVGNTDENAKEEKAARETKKEKKITREDIGRKIRAAIANGEITAENAREKWAAIEAKRDEKISRGDD